MSLWGLIIIKLYPKNRRIKERARGADVETPPPPSIFANQKIYHYTCVTTRLKFWSTYVGVGSNPTSDTM